MFSSPVAFCKSTERPVVPSEELTGKCQLGIAVLKSKSSILQRAKASLPQGNDGRRSHSVAILSTGTNHEAPMFSQVLSAKYFLLMWLRSYYQPKSAISLPCFEISFEHYFILLNKFLPQPPSTPLDQSKMWDII